MGVGSNFFQLSDMLWHLVNGLFNLSIQSIDYTGVPRTSYAVVRGVYSQYAGKI
jgi:hypothetical protein